MCGMHQTINEITAVLGKRVTAYSLGYTTTRELSKPRYSRDEMIRIHELAEIIEETLKQEAPSTVRVLWMGSMPNPDPSAEGEEDIIAPARAFRNGYIKEVMTHMTHSGEMGYW